MPQSLFCITPNDAVAQCIVEELEVSGVPRRKISVVCPVRIPAGDAMHHRDPTSRIGPSLSLTTCSALGGALGWLLGIGSLAIPGFGPTIAGGPIMQVIGDAAIGATLGGLSGALSRFGVPEYLAQRYEAGDPTGQDVHLRARAQAPGNPPIAGHLQHRGSRRRLPGRCPGGHGPS